VISFDGAWNRARSAGSGEGRMWVAVVASDGVLILSETTVPPEPVKVWVSSSTPASALSSTYDVPCESVTFTAGACPAALASWSMPRRYVVCVWVIGSGAAPARVMTLPKPRHPSQVR
jgi:hypothetical protein